MSLETAGIFVGIATGLGGLATGGFALVRQIARDRHDDRERERPARIWVQLAIISTSAARDDPSRLSRVLEVTNIKVAYKGGGRPFTVFGGSLLIEGERFSLGGLMGSSHHVPADVGGDFLIDHGREGEGLVVRDPSHKVFTLRLDCGEDDFREATFTPTLLPDPDGRLVYMEGEREGAYHEAHGGLIP